MELKSVTYTSLARLDLTAGDLVDIHQTAQRLNALDGITGLLIFNGRRFLQIIEGAEEAIDNLVGRLRADPRHGAFEIRDERIIEAPSFPDWSMELLTVSARYFEAREQIGELLPDRMVPEIRDLIFDMAQRIGAPIEMPE